MSSSNKKLSIIGVGLPRTGTSSLKIAFEKLHGGRCYHMTSFLFEGDDYDYKHWTKAMEGKTVKKEWVDFLEGRGYNTVVDFPPAYFFKDLVAAFPNAKVVLSTREPSSWHDSVKESIARSHDVLMSFPASVVLGLKPGMWDRMVFANKLAKSVPPGSTHSLLSGVADGKEASRKFYEEWVTAVKAAVPAKNLLLFSVKDGWKPLCKFLDVPEPSEPFPRTNDRETMAKTINHVRNVGWGIVLGTPVMLGVFIALLLWLLGML